MVTVGHCAFLLLLGCSILASCVAASYVVDVNAGNAQSFLAKQPVLIEFFAPWCTHCKRFEPQYGAVAEHLSQQGFTVGKCDITENEALTARFDVSSVPTIFLYRDRKIWKFKGALTSESLVNFATSEYLNMESMPWWTSPVGPMGTSKGVLIGLGVQLVNSLPLMSKTLGIPEWVGFIIVTVALGFTILVVTFVGVYLSVSHAKVD
jgi:thiol-disulfide isomerase/thioredoxin